MANNWTAYPNKVSKLGWGELTGFQQLTYSGYHTKSNYVTNVLNNYDTPSIIKVNSRLIYKQYVTKYIYNCVTKHLTGVIQLYYTVYLPMELLCKYISKRDRSFKQRFQESHKINHLTG